MIKGKKIAIVCLMIISVFASTSTTNAAAMQETETEKRERVYNEVLSGNITDDEDVIQVALEQYKEKKQKAAKSNQMVEDDYLSITQVIDETVNEEGHVLEDSVSTGLVIVDENLRRVPITEITSDGQQLSQYSIYATMKLSKTVDKQKDELRVNWFETTINYGTQMKASSLEQVLIYSPEPFHSYRDGRSYVSNPVGNNKYLYSTKYQGMIKVGRQGCGWEAVSYIKAGTSTLEMHYMLTTERMDGEWVRR